MKWKLHSVCMSCRNFLTYQLQATKVHKFHQSICRWSSTSFLLNSENWFLMTFFTITLLQLLDVISPLSCLSIPVNFFFSMNSTKTCQKLDMKESFGGEIALLCMRRPGVHSSSIAFWLFTTTSNFSFHAVFPE